jgi:hypothetical protein
MSFAISNVGGGYSSPQVYSGASGYASPSAKMSQVYSQIDSPGTGSITSDQFQQSFSKLNPPANFQSLGAEAIFNQLDPAGTGSISKSDFVTGMVNLMKSLSPNSSTSSSSSNGAQSINDSLKAFQQLSQKASTFTQSSIDTWF